MPNNGHLSVRHNFTGESQFIVAQWVLSINPLAEVGRQAYPPPHTEVSLNIINLQPVWHLVRFWRSSDGVSLDQIVLTLAGDARSGAVYPITIYNYVVGRGDGSTEPGESWDDPAPNDTSIFDERLQDKMFWVEERGTGKFLPTEYVVGPGGIPGWGFAESGKVFNDGGVYHVIVVDRVDIGDGGGSGPVSGDTIIITTDTAYNPNTHNGKTILARGVANVLQFPIPALATIPDGKFKLVSHGTARNVVILFGDSDSILVGNQLETKVILGIGEEVEIEFISGVAYITNGFNYDHVGQLEYRWNTGPRANRLIADGQSIADLTQYPRVQWLMDQVSTISTASWDLIATSSNGYWGRTGTVGRVPRLVDFIRAAQSNPGAYVLDTIGPHTHPFDTGDITGKSDNANDRNVMVPGNGLKTTGINNLAGTQTQPRHINMIPYICI